MRLTAAVAAAAATLGIRASATSKSPLGVAFPVLEASLEVRVAHPAEMVVGVADAIFNPSASSTAAISRADPARTGEPAGSTAVGSIATFALSAAGAASIAEAPEQQRDMIDRDGEREERLASSGSSQQRASMRQLPDQPQAKAQNKVRTETWSGTPR